MTAEDGSGGVEQHAPDQSTAPVIAWRSIWRVIGALLATALGLLLLWQTRPLLGMIVVSVFFALALEPGVRWLTSRYGWGRGGAVGAIYAAGLLFMILMVVVLIPAIVELAQRLGDNGPEWVASLNGWTDDNFGFTIVDDATGLTAAENVETFVGDWADEAFGAVTGIASAGATLLFSVSTIAMFTFYFVADSRRITRTVSSWFPPATQERLAWTLDEAIVQTGGYFYSRTLLMIINGIGFFVTMVAVGMPVAFALPLASFGGFVSVFIPVFGTYLGAAVPIVVTLAIQGLGAALVVLGYVLVYQLLENAWLSPRLSADSMNLSGGLAFASALAGGSIAGPMGALLALPTAALISSFVTTYATTYDVAYDAEDADRQDDTDSSESAGPS